MTFYQLQEPTAWADPPSRWSSTSIDDVEACPLRWQLLRSRWGEFDCFPVRPHSAVIEGQIVHEALDKLTRACGQRGNPVFGSAEFTAALADADFFTGFCRAAAEWQHRLASHPRPGPGFRLRLSAQELANRAVRMFREQYKPNGQTAAQVAERPSGTPIDLNALLVKKLALSEVKLTHPELPFMGILDRVQHTESGVEIIDFKTGKPNEKHKRQLLRYALLWWRTTGHAPVRVSAQYLDGIESWPIEQGALEDVEAGLFRQIQALNDALSTHPAAAKQSNACPNCAVRARCTAGWSVCEDFALANGHGDAELIVKAKPCNHGFAAGLRMGAEISVVYQSNIAKLLPELCEGHVIRVLDGVWRDNCTQFEIKPWTEVFCLSN